MTKISKTRHDRAKRTVMPAGQGAMKQKRDHDRTGSKRHRRSFHAKGRRR